MADPPTSTTPPRTTTTFGPEARFQWAPTPGRSNPAPWNGLQRFGTIDVTRDALSVALYEIDGGERYRVELPHA